MFLPVAHNGQTFNLVPQDSHYGLFAVMLDRETFASDADVEQGCPEDISERLGAFKVDHFYERVEAWTHYGYASTFDSITAAVAHIADNYRACDHGDATFTGDSADLELWNCDTCGADFTKPRD